MMIPPPSVQILKGFVSRATAFFSSRHSVIPRQRLQKSTRLQRVERGQDTQGVDYI